MATDHTFRRAASHASVPCLIMRNTRHGGLSTGAGLRESEAFPWMGISVNEPTPEFIRGYEGHDNANPLQQHRATKAARHLAERTNQHDEHH